MFLRYFTLRPNELIELSCFMARMNGKPEGKNLDGTVIPEVLPVHERMYNAFRSTLDSFLTSEAADKTEVFGKNPTRFLKQSDVTGSATRSVAFLYDFVTTTFRDFLQNEYAPLPGHVQQEMDRNEILSIIERLVKIRQEEMKNVPNPLASLISNSFIRESGEGMPDSVFDTYVGYRRSTEKGDIVRFVLRIERAGPRRTIRFDNRYKRNGDEWHVEGVGYVVQGTLHLIGHCTNHHDVSRGLRMMALNRHPKSKNLHGMLISRDRKEPIAARVFLVPAEEHRFKTDKANFDALADYVLDRDPHETYEQLIEQITRELPESLDSGYSDMFRYICNNNFTTLKCDPERDADLIDLELKFRNHFVENRGYDLEQMRAAYVNILTQAVANFELGEPVSHQKNNVPETRQEQK